MALESPPNGTDSKAAGDTEAEISQEVWVDRFESHGQMGLPWWSSG